MFLRRVEPYLVTVAPVPCITAFPALGPGTFGGLIGDMAPGEDCTILPTVPLGRRDELDAAVAVRRVVPSDEVLHPPLCHTTCPPV
jgi:hypothetical protein